MANSQAQHFLASSKEGPVQGKATPADFSSVLSNNQRANFALNMRHHEVALTGETPEEQAVALLKQAGKLRLKRKYAEAESALRRALELDPKNRQIHSILAEVLEKMNRFDKAILVHLDAWKLEPTNAKCLSCIGTCLMRLNQDEEAINYYAAALRIDPSDALSLARMQHLKRLRCDWSDILNSEKKLKLFRETKTAIDPFSFLPEADDPELQKKFSVGVSYLTRNVEAPQRLETPREKGEKIRLGYFSNDFFNHATMYLIGRQLELHDRDKFEVFIYDYGGVNDHDGQRRARDAADVYRQIADKENDEVARIARQDRLDIAIDLKGHTKDNRLNLFDERLAPVHVTYLGFPGTSGSENIDYMIADPITIPPKMRKFYTEKILYMPDCYQPNDDQRKAAGTKPARADVGLPEDAFVFCSFNTPYKVSPAEFDIWMKLLKSVQGSVLWFYAPRDYMRSNILKEVRKRGVDEDRIVFAGHANQKDHLARLPLADVFLDAFAVNAHTTASDALWAGVPVVTKIGKQFSARVASSLVNAVGARELIAATPQQYQALALKLARNPEYLADIKARIKRGIETGPLYDTEAFTRNFEALMEKALQRYDAGLKPDHISLK